MAIQEDSNTPALRTTNVLAAIVALMALGVFAEAMTEAPIEVELTAPGRAETVYNAQPNAGPRECDLQLGIDSECTFI